MNDSRLVSFAGVLCSLQTATDSDWKGRVSIPMISMLRSSPHISRLNARLVLVGTSARSQLGMSYFGSHHTVSGHQTSCRLGQSYRKFCTVACKVYAAVQAPPKLPVTVVSGFLGAGKTTLMRNVLTNKEGLTVAVLVNDMADINIDKTLLADKVDVVQRGEELVALSNGCICCSIREDLLREVRNLAAQGRFDYLLVESTGISLPLPVAASFSFRDELGRSLSDVAQLDTLVTVVDAERFVRCIVETKTLQEQGLQADENDERTVPDLLVEQVEFADVLVINKTDLVDERQLGEVEALLAKLNPSAKVVRTHHGQVPVADVIGTHRFSMEAAEQSPGWVQEINAFEEAREAASRARQQAEAGSAASSSCDQAHSHTPAGHTHGSEHSCGDHQHEADTGHNTHAFGHAHGSPAPSNSSNSSTGSGTQAHEHTHGQGPGTSSSATGVATQTHEHTHSQGPGTSGTSSSSGPTPAHSHAHGHGHHEHSPGHQHPANRRQTEAERFGVSSFVYFAQRPFHPGRLFHDVLSQTWSGVLRTKGFFWLATRHDICGLWQSAGGAWQGEPSALWSAALPEDERPAEDTDAVTWHPLWGDRCQQLVWIGIGLDEAKIRAMLDAALMTDEEMAGGPDAWTALEDPLPEWDMEDIEVMEEEQEEEVAPIKQPMRRNSEKARTPQRRR